MLLIKGPTVANHLLVPTLMQVQDHSEELPFIPDGWSSSEHCLQPADSLLSVAHPLQTAVCLVQDYGPPGTYGLAESTEMRLPVLASSFCENCDLIQVPKPFVVSVFSTIE